MADKVVRRARRARDKVEKMIREMKAWQGQRPTLLRVNMGDYLALTEVGFVRDGKWSGTDIEVKPG